MRYRTSCTFRLPAWVPSNGKTLGYPCRIARTNGITTSHFFLIVFSARSARSKSSPSQSRSGGKSEALPVWFAAGGTRRGLSKSVGSTRWARSLPRNKVWPRATKPLPPISHCFGLRRAASQFVTGGICGYTFRRTIVIS